MRTRNPHRLRELMLDKLDRHDKGITARLRASAKRRQQTVDRFVYAAVDERDGQTCQVCGIFCGASIHRHHKLYRSLGGLTTLDNLLSVCQKCHADIHAKRITVTP